MRCGTGQVGTVYAVSLGPLHYTAPHSSGPLFTTQHLASLGPLHYTAPLSSGPLYIEQYPAPLYITQPPIALDTCMLHRHPPNSSGPLHFLLNVIYCATRYEMWHWQVGTVYPVRRRHPGRQKTTI